MSANQTDPQFKLRVPPELKTKIEESAKLHNRSMNADMVARLEASFSDSSLGVGQARRVIACGYYEIGDAPDTQHAHEAAAKLLTEGFWAHPTYQLISVEGLDNGIRFWYSYPIDVSPENAWRPGQKIRFEL